MLLGDGGARGDDVAGAAAHLAHLDRVRPQGRDAAVLDGRDLLDAGDDQGRDAVTFGDHFLGDDRRGHADAALDVRRGAGGLAVAQGDVLVVARLGDDLDLDGVDVRRCLRERGTGDASKRQCNQGLFHAFSFLDRGHFRVQA